MYASCLFQNTQYHVRYFLPCYITFLSINLFLLLSILNMCQNQQYISLQEQGNNIY